MEAKAAKDLWADYLFLTREMTRFLAKGDMELFAELAGQRERLQQMIENHPDKTFTATEEGRTTLGLIRDLNAALAGTLTGRYNRHKKRDFVERAYAGGAAAAHTGGRMNRRG